LPYVTPPKETKLSPGYYPSWQLREWARKYPEWYQANKSLFTEKERKEIEGTQRYIQQRRQLMKEVEKSSKKEERSGSGIDVEKMSGEEKARAIRVLGMGKVILGDEKKDYHEYVYGKVPEGYVAPWTDKQKFYEIRNQILEYYHKYKDVLTPQEKQNINRMLHSKILPLDWKQYVIDREKIREMKEERFRRYELEHQPTVSIKEKEGVKTPFSMGEAPAKISYEELFGKKESGEIKTSGIEEIIPGMEFQQLSYSASKRLATSGIGVPKSWEEEMGEKGEEINERISKFNEKVVGFNEKVKSFEEFGRQLEWEGKLYSSSEIQSILRKYYAGKISGDEEIVFWTGYELKKIKVSELVAGYEKYLKKVEKYREQEKKLELEKKKLEEEQKDILKEISVFKGEVERGEPLFDRSISGQLWSGLQWLSRNIPRELDIAIGLFTPVTMPKAIESIATGGRPNTLEELAGVPIGFVSAFESFIGEGIPSIINLVTFGKAGLKPFVRVPDIGEAVIGSVWPTVKTWKGKMYIEWGNKRGRREAEFLMKHPGYTAGALLGEYVLGLGLGKIGGKVWGKISPRLTPITNSIRTRLSNIARRFPGYSEYSEGRGFWTHVFGEKSFPTFIKEKFVKPTVKKFTKTERRYFAEELEDIWGRRISYPTMVETPYGRMPRTFIEETLEMSIKRKPITPEMYRKLYSELGERVSGISGGFVEMGWIPERSGMVIGAPRSRWSSELFNIIRRGRKGEYFTIGRRSGFDIVHGISGIEFNLDDIVLGEAKTIDFWEYGRFIRQGNKIKGFRLIGTPGETLYPAIYEFHYYPKNFYKIVEKSGEKLGLKGTGFRPSGSGGVGFKMFTPVKTVEKTIQSLKPIVGLGVEKTEQKIVPALRIIPETSSIETSLEKTMGLEKIETKEFTIPSIEMPSLESKSYSKNLINIFMKPKPVEIKSPRTFRRLENIVGIGIGEEEFIGVPPMTAPIEAEITGVKEGLDQISEITGTSTSITDIGLTPPEEIPEIIPSTPTSPLSPSSPPPVPPILFPGFGGGFSGRRYRGWWKGFNIKFPIAEPYQLIGLGKKKSYRRKKKKKRG